MIIFMGSLFIPITLFVFFRKILNELKYQKHLKIILFVLAITGIAIVSFNNRSYSYFLLLIFPLISYWIYRLSFLTFRKKFNRSPIDTAMDWRTGLEKDRFFNIGFVIFGILIPFIIITSIIYN